MPTVIEARASDRNNLAYWFPILESTGVPVPKTKIVRTNVELLDLCDGKTPAGFDKFMAELRAACGEIGYPAFLRTGHGSDKHDWSQTCYLPDSIVIPRNMYNLVEWSSMADFCGLDTSVWAVREMLPLRTAFTAFRDFPVNCERRYFIEGGRVICHHAYWPPTAVEQGTPSDPAWLEKLEELNRESPDEVDFLTVQSELVSRAFDGAWSLDWAMDTSGKWWAIDMAEAARSYHWEGCPRTPTGYQK